jgi:hypothetical protein
MESKMISISAGISWIRIPLGIGVGGTFPFNEQAKDIVRKVKEISNIRFIGNIL